MAEDMDIHMDAISVSSQASSSSVEFVKERAFVDVSDTEDELDHTPPQLLYQPSWFSNPDDVVGPVSEATLFDWVICGCPIILIPLIRLVWRCVEACIHMQVAHTYRYAQHVL